MTYEKRFRRKRRGRNEDFTADLDAAITALAKKVSFAGISFTTLAKVADISPISLKKKYDNIDAVLAEYIKKYNYWLNDIIEKHYKEFEAGRHELFLSNLLKGIVRRLQKDTAMQQLLIWEIMEENEITMKTAVIREANTYMYNQFYNDLFKGTAVSFNGFMAIPEAAPTFAPWAVRPT